jgi:hypothetical protein
MEATRHGLNDLFKQLGLAESEMAIARFIAEHGSLPSATPLAEAPFWSPTQAAFLRQEILEDADWAEVVEALNSILRS